MQYLNIALLGNPTQGGPCALGETSTLKRVLTGQERIQEQVEQRRLLKYTLKEGVQACLRDEQP